MDGKKLTEMDWEDLRHFAAFVACGSLSGAARQLGVEHATVARRIASLESELGMKLVDRRGRRLTLTPDGDRVASVATRIAVETQELARLARGANAELKGDVIISAPPAYAAAFLAGPLVRLRKRHPDLRLRVSGEGRVVSLDRREADIAIRLNRPTAGDLTVTKLGEVRFHLYALTRYLKETARSDWNFIGLDGSMAHSPQQSAVERMTEGHNFGLSSDHLEIQLAFVLADGGVAMLPEFMAAPEVSLDRACPDDPPLIREVWLIIHSDMMSAAPIRAVVDFLKLSRS